MSELTYCANGCTTRHGDETHRTSTEAPSQLCTRCEARLHDWLTKIPESFALVPMFLEHGTTEGNPESKATKKADAPAPMRLDVIDILDTRLGRKWLGTEVSEDRRGPTGTLIAWATLIADERTLPSHPDTITGCCQLIDRHRLWAAEQDWIDELYNDVKTINRTLSDAIGDYRKKPVGHCHVIPEGAQKPCGGPLFASTYGGVTCARCRATWDAGHLRQLGLAQATAQETA